MERQPQAWRKVVTAYCLVDELSHLRADCLYTGISSGPMLGNEYGKFFTFFIVVVPIMICQRVGSQLPPAVTECNPEQDLNTKMHVYLPHSL